MRVMQHLKLVGGPTFNEDKFDKSRLRVNYRLAKGHSGSIRVIAPDFAFISPGIAFEDKTAIPQAMNEIRVLLAHGNWEIAEALLDGPKQMEALVERCDGDREVIQERLIALLKAGMIVQERNGYCIANPNVTVLISLLQVFSSALSKPSGIRRERALRTNRQGRC
jgi:hypothetical protein